MITLQRHCVFCDSVCLPVVFGRYDREDIIFSVSVCERHVDTVVTLTDTHWACPRGAFREMIKHDMYA